jgi:hypothetical protein
MTLSRWPAATGLLFVSASVSLLYVSTTWLVFESTRHVEAPAPVRFVARNSLIIFLVHMPVVLALHPVLVGWGLTYWARVGVQCVVCVGGIGALSEAIHAFVYVERLRAQVFEMLTGRRRLPLVDGEPLAS